MGIQIQLLQRFEGSDYLLIGIGHSLQISTSDAEVRRLLAVHLSLFHQVILVSMPDKKRHDRPKRKISTPNLIEILAQEREGKRKFWIVDNLEYLTTQRWVTETDKTREKNKVAQKKDERKKRYRDKKEKLIVWEKITRAYAQFESRASEKEG